MSLPLLIFDLDGTLIDSAPDIAVALNKTLSHFGKPNVPYDIVVAHIGDGLRKLLADFFPEFQNSPAADYKYVEDHFLRTYEEEMYHTTQPFPSAMDFLRGYAGPMGIVTNKNEDPARKIVRHLGLDKIPWIGVFGADTFAEKKPHPLPLLEMMKRADRDAANTFMIGDGTPDMKAARAAGVSAIAVRFGYTQMTLLQSYGPVAILDDYKDLQNLILGLINR